MINAYNPTFWLLSSKMKVLAWFISLKISANLQGRTIKGFEIYGKKWDYILDIRWRFTPIIFLKYVFAVANSSPLHGQNSTFPDYDMPMSRM